jgi:hypothetical protein
VKGGEALESLKNQATPNSLLSQLEARVAQDGDRPPAPPPLASIT